MSIQKLRPTFTFTKDRLEQLKAAVPESFADRVAPCDAAGLADGRCPGRAPGAAPRGLGD